MSTPEPSAPKPAYGKLIRERGTLRLVIIACVLFVAYYAYSSLETMRMLQVKWPPLKPDASGLTIIGLRTRDLPGKPKQHTAVQSSYAWHVRTPDDAAESDPPEDTPESHDRVPVGSVATRASRGRVIPVEELLSTCAVVLRREHFSGASIVADRDPFRDKAFYKVTMDLTPEGRSRYWQYSRAHAKEALAFIINGEIVTCPEITAMDTTLITIDPVWVKEDADRLAAAVSRRH